MADLTPITRKERFLSAAAGNTETLPEPITREEMYLKKIAEGGGSDVEPLTPEQVQEILSIL